MAGDGLSYVTASSGGWNDNFSEETNAACKELYVFQRTPSSVDERGNVRTDEDYYFQKIKQEPGWQTVFQENFAGINTGRAKACEEDLSKRWLDRFNDKNSKSHSKYTT